MEGLDLEIVERCVRHDDTARSYTYHLVGELDLDAVPGLAGRGKLAGLEATLAVHAHDERTALVVYDVVAPEKIVDRTRDGYQAAIDALKAQLEA